MDVIEKRLFKHLLRSPSEGLLYRGAEFLEKAVKGRNDQHVDGLREDPVPILAGLQVRGDVDESHHDLHVPSMGHEIRKRAHQHPYPTPDAGTLGPNNLTLKRLAGGQHAGHGILLFREWCAVLMHEGAAKLPGRFAQHLVGGETQHFERLLVAEQYPRVGTVNHDACAQVLDQETILLLAAFQRELIAPSMGDLPSKKQVDPHEHAHNEDQSNAHPPQGGGGARLLLYPALCEQALFFLGHSANRCADGFRKALALSCSDHLGRRCQAPFIAGAHGFSRSRYSLGNEGFQNVQTFLLRSVVRGQVTQPLLILHDGSHRRE